MTFQSNPLFQIWAPVVFCAILSATKLAGGGSGDPAFYSFLPMCFFGVAAIQLSLVKRIKTLESALRGREADAQGSGGA